jgi:hypothetical protein
LSEECRSCDNRSKQCDQCKHEVRTAREDVYIVLGDARGYGPREAFEGC